MENMINSKVLVLDWDQAGDCARKVASLISAAFPQAVEEEVRAAAWIAVGDRSSDRDWVPHLVGVPDEATDTRVLACGDEYLSSEYALAVVDGKIVDCQVIPAADAERLLPSELVPTARRLVDALQQWGEFDEDGSDEYEDYDEEEDEEDDSDDEYDDSNDDSNSESEEEVVSL